MRDDLLFIDTETGGLDATAPLIEVAWATLAGPLPQRLVLPHNRDQVSEEAKRINRYDERGLGDEKFWAETQDILDFLDALNEKTLVGANVQFDAAAIRHAFGFDAATTPWKYRMLDIESMAFMRFGLTSVPGLKKIYEILTGYGYHSIPAPDHTAAGDVATTLACFRVLTYA